MHMGLPWKKIGTVLLGIGRSGLLPIPGLPEAIMAIDGLFGPKAGATKLQVASQIADGLVTAAVDLTALTPDQATQYQLLKTAYINTYVAAKNVEAQLVHDEEGLRAFLASFRHVAVPASVVVTLPVPAPTS